MKEKASIIHQVRAKSPSICSVKSLLFKTNRTELMLACPATSSKDETSLGMHLEPSGELYNCECQQINKITIPNTSNVNKFLQFVSPKDHQNL